MKRRKSNRVRESVAARVERFKKQEQSRDKQPEVHRIPSDAEEEVEKEVEKEVEEEVENEVEVQEEGEKEAAEEGEKQAAEEGEKQAQEDAEQEAEEEGGEEAEEEGGEEAEKEAEEQVEKEVQQKKRKKKNNNNKKNKKKKKNREEEGFIVEEVDEESAEDSSSAEEAEERERRSKSHEDPAHFRSREERDRYGECYNDRNIVKGRAFDWAFLKELKFPYLERLERWGWRTMLTMERPVYRNVPKFLYYNARLEQYDEFNTPIRRTEEPDGFHTFLQRQHLHITYKDLRRALGNPRQKRDAPTYDKDAYNHLEGAQRVFGNPGLETTPKSTEGLPIHKRILHFMICQNLMPRQGDYSGLNQPEIWLMDKIIAGKPPNLTSLVMHYMKRAIGYNKKPTNRGLLYGRVISQLVDDLKLPGLKDGDLKNDSPIPFGPQTIGLLGFKKNEVTGEWEPTARRRRRTQNHGRADLPDIGAGEEDAQENVGGGANSAAAGNAGEDESVSAPDNSNDAGPHKSGARRSEADARMEEVLGRLERVERGEQENKEKLELIMASLQRIEERVAGSEKHFKG